MNEAQKDTKFGLTLRKGMLCISWNWTEIVYQRLLQPGRATDFVNSEKLAPRKHKATRNCNDPAKVERVCLGSIDAFTL